MTGARRVGNPDDIGVEIGDLRAGDYVLWESTGSWNPKAPCLVLKTELDEFEYDLTATVRGLHGAEYILYTNFGGLPYFKRKTGSGPKQLLKWLQVFTGIARSRGEYIRSTSSADVKTGAGSEEAGSFEEYRR